jgi:hypothetical protein
MKSCAILAALGCLAGSVLGHGQVQNFTINGQYNQGFIRMSTSLPKQDRPLLTHVSQTVDYYYQKQNTGHFPNVAGWYVTNANTKTLLLKHIADTADAGTPRT